MIKELNIKGLKIEGGYINTFGVHSLVVHCITQEEYSKMITFFHATQADENWQELRENSAFVIGETGDVYYKDWGDCLHTKDTDGYFFSEAEDIIDKLINNKPMKKVNKKSYKATVEVEKTIKYTLPKYTVGQPIHVDLMEQRKSDNPVRYTIIPFIAYWNYEEDEVVYRYNDEVENIKELTESYIDKHLIK